MQPPDVFLSKSTKNTLLMLSMLCFGCIENATKFTYEAEEDNLDMTAGVEARPSLPSNLRSDLDPCSTLKPPPLLREITGRFHMFGGCGHIVYVREDQYWLEGPGLDEPLLVGEGDNFPVQRSSTKDNRVMLVERVDSAILIDFDGPWISPPLNTSSTDLLRVELDEGRRLGTALKINDDTLAVYSEGQLIEVARGELLDQYFRLDSGDHRRVFPIYDAEGVSLVHFDSPGVPTVERLALPDFSRAAGNILHQSVRRDEVHISADAALILHLRQSFTERDDHVERDAGEGVLYRGSDLEPLVTRPIDSALGEHSFLNLCLLADRAMRSGCVVLDDPHSDAAVTFVNQSGELRQFEGLIGLDPMSQTLWIKSNIDQSLKVYDLINHREIGPIPPYKLPRLNDPDSIFNSYRDNLSSKVSSSVMFIKRTEDDLPSLPALYYINLQTGVHGPALEPSQSIPYNSDGSMTCHMFSFIINDETQSIWFTQRDDRLISAELSLLVDRSDPWSVHDGFRYRLLTAADGSHSIEILNAFSNQILERPVDVRYDHISGRAYDRATGSERSGHVLYLHNSSLYGSNESHFMYGFVPMESGDR